MAAHLRFYHFESSPFDRGSSKRGIVLGTQSLKGAFSHVKQGLHEDAPRICLSGSAGIGKTSFCRALPKLLADTAQVVVILDPRRPWRKFRTAIAKKFDLEAGVITRQTLMAARRNSTQWVLAIDRAETLSHESLDHLDVLLQYKSDEGRQLLHCVMLANLDAASTGADVPLFWWLDKFTTMQLQFPPIPIEGLRYYVEKHLAKAGWAGDELFTDGALTAIHGHTGGIPRAVNELCERILIEGGTREITSISGEFIEELCGERVQGPPPKLVAENPALSAERSIGDFGTSPTAQEMLDANTSEGSPPGDAEIDSKRDQFLGDAQNIPSSRVTPDRPEALRVAPEAPVRELTMSTTTLELEHEPAATSATPRKSFYDQASSVGIPTGMIRAPLESEVSSRRGSGRMMMALLLLALVAGAIYSRLSPTAEQIDPAELAASDTLEEQIELVVTPEPPKEPSLQPSLLDRADKLAADRALAPPSGSDPESRDPTRVARSAANPSTDTANSTGTETSTRTAAEATSREASIRFSDDMLIVNEYTAIPAAASSAIKPASPAAPARSDTDRNSSRSSDAPASLEPSLPPAAKVRQADSFVAP